MGQLKKKKDIDSSHSTTQTTEIIQTAKSDYIVMILYYETLAVLILTF